MSLCKACGQPLVFPTHLAQTEKAFVRPKRAFMAIWKMSGDFPSHDDDSDDRLVSANIRKQSRSDYEPGTGA